MSNNNETISLNLPGNSPERNFEDGQYLHVCNDCDKTFIGHKRRRVCKLCEKKRMFDISSKEFRDLLRSISRRLEFLTIINEGSFTKLLDASVELNEDSLKINLPYLQQCSVQVHLLGEELPKLMAILSGIPKK